MLCLTLFSGFFLKRCKLIMCSIDCKFSLGQLVPGELWVMEVVVTQTINSSGLLSLIFGGGDGFFCLLTNYSRKLN